MDWQTIGIKTKNFSKIIDAISAILQFYHFCSRSIKDLVWSVWKDLEHFGTIKPKCWIGIGLGWLVGCLADLCVLHLEELGWFHRKLIYLLYFPQQKKQFPKRPPLQPSFLPSWIKKAWKQTKTFQNLLITKKPHCISWSDRPPSSQTAR